MPKNRGVTGRFLPGNNANPNGRPKGIAALVQAETRDGGELVGYLLRVLRDNTQKTELRMQAAQVLLDRGFGKAVVQLEASVDATLDATVTQLDGARALIRERLTTDDADRIARRLLG